MKECINYGLENHKTNQIYQWNIEKARQMTLENVALYLPQVSGDLRFDDYLDQQTQIVSSEAFGLNETPLQFGKKFTTTGTIEAEQALFDRLLLVSFRGLRPNMEMANLSFRQNQESLIYNISQSYIQTHILQQQIALLDENRIKLKKQLEIVKLQVEKGVAKKIDASRISVALNNVTSQLDVAESGYAVALNKLKNAMGMELKDSLALSDSVKILPLELTAETAFDLNSKTEIRLQQNSLKLMDVQKKRISAGYFPKLSFFARYSAQAYNDDFASAFSKWYDFSSFGLKLNVPIFDGFQKSAQRKQQVIGIRNAQLNLELSQQAFELQYQNAASQVNRAKLMLDNNEENVALAKDVFDNITLMYQQGIVPLSEFLNAETAYKESQLNYITAMLNYYMAVIDLEKAKGTLEDLSKNL